LLELLAADRAYLDGIYFCPHRPDEGCACRKPGGELVLTAARELDLDLTRSFAIGDKAADVELGERWLAGGLLVRTGMGRSRWRRRRRVPMLLVGCTPTCWPRSRISSGPPGRNGSARGAREWR
jgi:histidinol phosphatase-like enzyme